MRRGTVTTLNRECAATPHATFKIEEADKLEIILVQIKNGWLLVQGQESLYCKDAAELHKEIEYLIGVVAPLPEPPKPPTNNKPAGVRQFDDED